MQKIKTYHVEIDDGYIRVGYYNAELRQHKYVNIENFSPGEGWRLLQILPDCDRDSAGVLNGTALYEKEED